MFFNKEGQSQLPREVDVPGLGRPAKESLHINLERYFKNIDAYIYILTQPYIKGLLSPVEMTLLSADWSSSSRSPMQFSATYLKRYTVGLNKLLNVRRERERDREGYVMSYDTRYYLIISFLVRGAKNVSSSFTYPGKMDGVHVRT